MLQRTVTAQRSGLAAAVLGAAVLALAQTPAPAPPPQPTFRTEANYVRVDVYPTRDGAPIPDLTQADFELPRAMRLNTSSSSSTW